MPCILMEDADGRCVPGQSVLQVHPVGCGPTPGWNIADVPLLPPPQVAARIEAAQGEGFLRAIKAEWESHNKSVHVGAWAGTGRASGLPVLAELCTRLRC